MENKDWQPIETAPKDGSRLLLFNEKEGIFIGRYDKYFEQFVGTEESNRQSAWVDDVEGFHEEFPEFWKPLPDGPTLKKE